MMLVEQPCLRPNTQWHIPLKAYKAFGTPLQANSHVVIVRQVIAIQVAQLFDLWPFDKSHIGCCGAIMV